MPELSCTPQVFAILTALVEERCGLSYTLRDRLLFESKAAARAADAGFESMLDYYYFLRYDDPEARELNALVEALVVQETYFFRELAALEVAVDELLAPRVAAGARPRVWCAACATGEEVLTLAMLLADRNLLGHVELIASDISERGLAKARRGVYSKRALRSTPHQGLAARFLAERGTELVADPTLLAKIDFRQVNLLEPPELGAFDVILCRNVLIYFDDRRVRTVVGQLGEMLVPDGALIVGVSESLLRFGTELRCEELRGSFLYRKASR
ncbi:MAG TPA: protein-glutamate O-methyltransferase CheR [Polyangiales bacterium]|nr:protein-glutamate O-methyltransferase CheR [Polyangiales bacterium]